ncbi:MAG: LacI family DNA-binding transcriptional regulator [Janthinobacterium lividum]
MMTGKAAGGANKDTTGDPERTRRKRAPRFKEIAEAASVSEATVDRVLNERGSVSATARQRVVEAAQRLGVQRILPDTRHGIIHFDLLMPINDTPFFKRLEQSLQRAIAMLDRRIIFHRVHLKNNDDAGYVRAILHPPYKRSGLIVVSASAPRIAAALRKVIDAGETVVALVSQLPGIPGCHYTGIDNERAGHTAGYMIGRLMPASASVPERGKVLILSAFHDFPAHRQRVAGCIQALSHSGAAHQVHHVEKETFDDPDICFRIVSDALKRSRIAAIYNTGEGSAGIANALEKRGAGQDVIWVAHEMHDEHRVLLTQGTLDLVIDQDPDRQALCALQQLLYAAQQVAQAPPGPLGDFSLFMQPNVRMTPYLS